MLDLLERQSILSTYSMLASGLGIGDTQMKVLGEEVWERRRRKGEEVMYEVPLCARLFAKHWESR